PRTTSAPRSASPATWPACSCSGSATCRCRLAASGWTTRTPSTSYGTSQPASRVFACAELITRPSVACTERQRTAGEKRDIVAGTYLTAAAALVIAGIVTGVLIVICLGIHREERRGSLTKQSDSRMDRGVRRLNGAGSRGYYLRVVSNDDSNYDDDSYDQAA